MPAWTNGTILSAHLMTDLNCDLGEGEPLARTRALMRSVASVNVACGGHAGNGQTMEQCVRLALQFKVRLGAHPGAWSRADRGRGPVSMSEGELELLLLQQIGALQRVAIRHGRRLHHIKLHGSLYHATETDRRLGTCYLRTVRRYWPDLLLYVRAGGFLAKRASRFGVGVWEEAFADRAYQADGQLVPRCEPHALLVDPARVEARLRTWSQSREIIALDGTPLVLSARTFCIHSDTPNAVALARLAARWLRRKS